MLAEAGGAEDQAGRGETQDMLLEMLEDMTTGSPGRRPPRAASLLAPCAWPSPRAP